MTVAERAYLATMEITYTGGTLPDDSFAALATALDASVARSARPYTVVSVSTTLLAARPLSAIQQLDAEVDRALLATGLFEEFDVTGKILRVAPA